MGRLSDRLRGHTLIAIELVFLTVGVVAFPTIPSPCLVTAVMLLIGVEEQSLDVGANPLLMWAHSPKSRPLPNNLHLSF